MEQRLYSELLQSDWAPHPISKRAPSHPAEKAHFGRLYPGSCPFGHDPQLMTIGESRNIDWPVNRELRLAAQLLLLHSRPVHRPHYCRSCTDLSAKLPFHPSLTREQNPKILNSSTCGRNSPPTWSGKATFFRLSTWPRTWRCWFSTQSLHTRLQTVPVHAEGPGLKGPTWIHNPQKAETKSCGTETGHPPAPWLCLEILS